MADAEALLEELPLELGVHIVDECDPRHMTTVPKALASVHPKMMRAEGEGHPQDSAEPKQVIGGLVERALALCGLTKQEAAFRMGYSDSGVISRWCSGTERPLFDKLHTLPGFANAWVVALAERDPQMDVATIVTIRRRMG